MAAAAAWLDGELSSGAPPDERALLIVDEYDRRGSRTGPGPWTAATTLTRTAGAHLAVVRGEPGPVHFTGPESIHLHHRVRAKRR